jgi:hypothetical protein
MNDVPIKLFADDTNIYCSCEDLRDILKKCGTIVIELLVWCTHNILGIYWTKTFLMVITNKRIKNPLFFIFNDIEIKSLEDF